MGLFDFVKDAGARLFGFGKEETEAEKASSKHAKVEALNNQVKSLNLQIDALRIELEDDVASVFGTAPSQAEKEKVLLAVGNVQGIAKVDDRITVVQPQPEARFYTVKSGDTLSRIAREYYGNAMKYPVIFEANKPMLKHPDKIYPGQVLRIPPAD